jgi:uncharacterized protein (TIGR02300 family)
VAKSELGTKRVCPTTGRKFYDLNKDPVISPYTGEVVPVAPIVTRGRPEAAKAPVAAQKEQEVEVAETETAEFVSLEDADAEQQGKKKVPAGDVADTEDDIEVEDDDDMDDATFIADEEEGDDDVTDIIGDGIEKEEES